MLRAPPAQLSTSGKLSSLFRPQEGGGFEADRGTQPGRRRLELGVRIGVDSALELWNATPSLGSTPGSGAIPTK